MTYRQLDSQGFADALVAFSIGADGIVREALMRRASPRTARAYDFQDLDLLPVD